MVNNRTTGVVEERMWDILTGTGADYRTAGVVEERITGAERERISGGWVKVNG